MEYGDYQWDNAITEFTEWTVYMARIQAMSLADPRDRNLAANLQAARSRYNMLLGPLMRAYAAEFEIEPERAAVKVRDSITGNVIATLAAAAAGVTQPSSPALEELPPCTREEMAEAKHKIALANDNYGWGDRDITQQLVWRTAFNLLDYNDEDQVIYEASEPFCEGTGSGEYCRRGGNYYHQHNPQPVKEHRDGEQ